MSSPPSVTSESTTELTAPSAVSYGIWSEAGVKTKNDDHCGVCIPEDNLLHTKGVVAVIADGVSQSEQGGAAARTSVNGFISDYYSTPESWTVKNAARRILGALNRWLYGSYSQGAFPKNNSLTTLSALVIKSHTAHIFHVGDTRIYLYRDKELECLTQDHVKWRAAEKSFLTRALGAELHVEIDYRNIAIDKNDIFVLTTDGIHEYLNNQELKSLLDVPFANLNQIAKQIVITALSAASQDNATCVIVKVNELPHQNSDDYYHHLTELPFPPPLHAGVQLDDYRIMHEIHASKRTHIYAAIDLTNQQQVIIKAPSIQFQDDSDYIERFLYEEWIGRRLLHANLLKVCPPPKKRRFLYYVTEYLHGNTLRQWMRDNPQCPLNTMRNIIEQIAKGLQAMHRMEMVHQDLKPENIFIDNNGLVKIIDFGSVRISGIEEVQKPRSTSQGVLGTINYSAPELMSTGMGSIQADIFSLGVITYELLCGHLPFGDHDSTESRLKARYISLATHQNTLPLWLDGALRKATVRNPADRYEALSEFLFDLSHPNMSLVKKDQPLLERDPLEFWRGLALISLGIIVVLLAIIFYLIRR